MAPTADRLSTLPDALLLTILSLLPTPAAARTSLLSTRFRDLWKLCPSVELNSAGVTRELQEKFFAMADRVLSDRNPSHPLLSLDLRLTGLASRYTSLVSPLLAKVCTFSLQHLTILCFGMRNLDPVIPAVFSMESLESLSLDAGKLYTSFFNECELPSAVGLTRLRTLSLGLHAPNPDQLHRLVSELPSLEDLTLNVYGMKKLVLSSNTVRKLKLVITSCYPALDSATLCLPSLEFLHLENKMWQLLQFHAEFVLLRRAVVTLKHLGKEDCSALAVLMNCLSHVEELILNVTEREREKYPFLILFEPGKEIPEFFNLKHLEVVTCFSEQNLKAVISMLNHSPALESVKLVHQLPKFTGQANQRRRRDWKSKLPRNADGNYRYAYFRNLHQGKNKNDFLKALSKKCTCNS